jgi:hypothetical protein
MESISSSKVFMIVLPSVHGSRRLLERNERIRLISR